MSKNNRGQKKKTYDRSRSKVYEWDSPTLRLLGDLCLLGSVLIIVAVVLTYKTQGLAIRIFSGCFLFFGLSEILRAADNRSKGGPKKTTTVYLILGFALIAAGAAFFLFVASKQPLAAAA